MNRSCMSVFALIAVLMLSLSAFATGTPLQLNLAGKAGLPWCCESVYGLRLNILHGDCDDVSFLDLGVFNRTRKSASGIRVGGINWADTAAYGLTVGAFNADKYNAGLTVGFLNHDADGAGVQVGFVNSAASYTGLQVSFLNVATDDFKGIQVGLLNFNLESVIPVFPFINIGSGK